MRNPVKWGVLGTGGIAALFTRDLELVDDAVVLAVGSRQEVTARRFADRFGIARAYGSYETLVADPDVDVVYVATPQTFHRANVELALAAGKPVLCEKPFTISAAEAREVVALARERNLFLMEAMWTRFLPHLRQIGELLEAGELGEVVGLTADHGQHIPAGDGHRLHRPDLGGGALLDLGVYPVSLASLVFGRPARITGVGTLLPNGLDAQTSIVLSYDSGAHATLTTSLAAQGSNRATIIGTQARIEIDPVWYSSTSFSLIRLRPGTDRRFEYPKVGNGLRHQAIEVGRLLREGATESPDMPLDETVAVMETLDEVRHQIGLTFP